ncbi:MAG: hypothetical protein FJ144_00010 [Deltaproteobacteria bacterium]|nr:hypothetical protein [Deltaproteobacteria bacterium]
MKPIEASPLQYDRPVAGLTPAGSEYVSWLGFAPRAAMVTVAPATTGLPIRVSSLAVSLALTRTLRFAAVLGFFTTSTEPSTV